MTRFLFACLLFATSLPALAQTAVSLVPTGWDWVSGGVARTYTTTNSRLDFSNSSRSQIVLNISGNDGKWWYLYVKAPVGETLRPGEYFFAERSAFASGRSPGLDFSGDGRGCNTVDGYFAIRQIQFDAQGKLQRLEAAITHYCESTASPALGIGVVYQAPALSFSIGAADFARTGRNYYGETSTFTLVHSAPDKFQYKSSGLRDVWTMNFAAPTGQTQFAKGVYLTEGTAKPGVAGMDIALGQNRKGEYGKLDVLTVAYRNGVVVQLSARFYFYSDAARTQLVRSGRINFWK